jgi:ubiquinone biosynthesis monooxygenase Coq7
MQNTFKNLQVIQKSFRLYSTNIINTATLNPFITHHDRDTFNQQQIEHQSPATPQISKFPHARTREEVNRSGRIWGWDHKKSAVDSMIRVDQAGEFGAVTICKGQRFIMPKDPTIREIQSQEEGHLEVMQNLAGDRRVRPTIMSPIWHVAGFTLGIVTAMLGRPAAMACHKAVEDVISQHYNNQIREIYEFSTEGDEFNDFSDESLNKAKEEKLENELSEEEKRQREAEYLFTSVHQRNEVYEQELRTILKQFRDDELNHGEMAVKNQAESAPFYKELYTVIKTACRTAIWISKRI